jgi:hypothetical protein
MSASGEAHVYFHVNLCADTSQTSLGSPKLATQTHVRALKHINGTSVSNTKVMVAGKAAKPRDLADDLLIETVLNVSRMDDVPTTDAADVIGVVGEQSLEPVRMWDCIVISVSDDIFLACIHAGSNRCDLSTLVYELDFEVDFWTQPCERLLRGDVAGTSDDNKAVRHAPLCCKAAKASLQGLRPTVRWHDHRD